MNKTELVAAMAEAAEISKKDAEKAVEEQVKALEAEKATILGEKEAVDKKLQEAQVAAGTKKATGPDPKKLAEAISGQHSDGFDLFAKVPHITFPGGKYLRSPLLALGMLWHRLKELR